MRDAKRAFMKAVIEATQSREESMNSDDYDWDEHDFNKEPLTQEQVNNFKNPYIKRVALRARAKWLDAKRKYERRELKKEQKREERKTQNE